MTGSILRLALLAPAVWLLLGAQAEPEVRTLATHEPPSDELIKLLHDTGKERGELAARLSVEVIQDGDDVLMWDADLYNFRQMDLCIKGFNVLLDRIKEGRYGFRFGDLDPAAREAVREIFLAQGAGESAGPALFDDSTYVGIGMSWVIQMSSGSKSAFGVADEPERMERPTQSDLKRFTSTQTLAFAKDELPKRVRKRHDVGLVLFRNYSERPVNSARRARAIALIGGIWEERIKNQSQAYASAQRALETAFDARFRPEAGQSANSLPEELRSQLQQSLVLGASQQIGLTDPAEARRFLEDARITRATPSVDIGVFWLGDNVGRSHFVSTKVRR